MSPEIATTTAPSLDPDQAVIVGAVYNEKDQRIGTTYQGQLVWEPLEADVFGHTTRQRYGNGLQTQATYDAQTGELNDATVWKTVTLNGQPPTQVAMRRGAVLKLTRLLMARAERRRTLYLLVPAARGGR